ncbi:MAG: TIGR00730 family Rossman fold protein, partial [Actinobacteria bacterium]|nr:TIGR00730 family Rossman fold protein [Actinomycetota bacterium]
MKRKYSHHNEDSELLKAPDTNDKNFTHSDPWRVLRIQSEFVEGFNTLAGIGSCVSIFGASRTKPDDEY